MKFLNQMFLKGLVLVLPITLALYLLITLFIKAEAFLGGILKNFFGANLYVPGSGVLACLVLITAMGFFVENFLTRRLVKFFLHLLEKIPLYRVIYQPLKDLMSMFSSSTKEEGKKVVFVYFESLDLDVLGLVTRDEFDDLENFQEGEGKVLVYFPMSYMIGGFSALIDRERIKLSQLPVEKALKLAVTGWVKAKE